MNRNIKLYILALIFILGFLLRFLFVRNIPPGVNRDEASIGYTAYSLIKTGKDEYGKLLPISFKSFGDWKLPLYIYFDIIPVSLFGLDELSTRLPSIIVGSIMIVLVYILTLILFSEISIKYPVALFGAFLFAISPWNVHFSRVASEANLALFFIILALIFYFSKPKRSVYLALSSTFLALSLYAYHGSHVVTPILFVGLLFTLVKNKNLKRWVLFIAPFTLLGSVIYLITISSADITKIQGLTPISGKSLIHEKVNLPRLTHKNYNSLYSKIFHNKLSLFTSSFINGYIRSFSPEFLFIKGGINKQHNIPDFGKIYLWESLFIILGLYILFKNKLKYRYFLLFWLLISPIPAAITKDAPHSARMFFFIPLPDILAALGVGYVLLTLSKYINLKVLGIGIFFMLIINYMIFLDRYFVHFPVKAQASWGGIYRQLAQKISSRYDNYQEIIIDRPEFTPYIYWLFYLKVDPLYFQKTVERYMVDEEGFHFVKSIDKLKFKKIDWAQDLVVPGKLLVSWSESIPTNATYSSKLIDRKFINRHLVNREFLSSVKAGDVIINKIVDTVKLNDKSSYFDLIEVKKIAR